MGKNAFLPLLWWALARRLRDVWIRVLIIWHLITHTIFASFVWARSTHAMSSRRLSVCTVSIFSWESSALICLSFRGRRGSLSVSRGSGPAVAEARRRMSLWGSQTDLADELERGLFFLRSVAANQSELLDYDDAISLTSSDPAASALLGSAQDEQEMSAGEEVETEPSHSSCPAYDKLLEVIERATARLDLPWKQQDGDATGSSQWVLSIWP